MKTREDDGAGACSFAPHEGGPGPGGLVTEMEGSLCEIRIGGRLFGMETRSILEVLGARQIDRVPLAPWFVAGMVSYRGEVLAVVSLARLVGLEGTGRDGCVIVLDGSGSGGGVSAPFGLAVEDVGGIVQLTERGKAAQMPAGHGGVCRGAFQLRGEVMCELGTDLLLPARLLIEERRAHAVPGVKILLAQGDEGRGES